MFKLVVDLLQFQQVGLGERKFIVALIIIFQIFHKLLYGRQQVPFQPPKHERRDTDQRARDHTEHDHAPQHQLHHALAGDAHLDLKRRLRQKLADRRLPDRLLVQKFPAGEHPDRLTALVHQAHIPVLTHRHAGKGLQNAFDIHITSQADTVSLRDLAHVRLAAAGDDIPLLFDRVRIVLQHPDLFCHSHLHLRRCAVPVLLRQRQMPVRICFPKIQKHLVLLPILPDTRQIHLAQLRYGVLNVLLFPDHVHVLPERRISLSPLHDRGEQAAADAQKAAVQLAHIELRHLIHIPQRLVAHPPQYQHASRRVDRQHQQQHTQKTLHLLVHCLLLSAFRTMHKSPPQPFFALSFHSAQRDTFRKVLLQERIYDEQRQHRDERDRHSNGSRRQLGNLGADISCNLPTSQILDIRYHLVQQVLNAVQFLSCIP